MTPQQTHLYQARAQVSITCEEAALLNLSISPCTKCTEHQLLFRLFTVTYVSANKSKIQVKEYVAQVNP